MSVRLNVLPIARQDVVIRRCKRKTIDPTVSTCKRLTRVMVALVRRVKP
jgi:hypothetical protein